ncbi:hypothetical protein PQ478_08510 [Alkalihalophilus pseudofirmus]|uniref:hypothetical protein n=1 Tax=Alkalihalophilus pseudofirmus TaxID=79885 RepID=UPI00259BBC98|nr:hypothetical protein [Alkalihalophilus pseudofirmus]WEG18510.1 hypothetical protein PQ478_08510 [Alkalihalophilus pseudofirmus]
MTKENTLSSPPLSNQEGIALDYASLRKLVVRDLNDMNKKNTTLRKYSKDKVLDFMKSPELFETQLREISLYLYQFSPHYKRLINYFANMLTFDYIVQPYQLKRENINIEAYKKSYYKNLHMLEKYNFKHEFSKIMKTLFKEEIFYGYEHENSESYFIQKLNPDFCKISTIEDGCINFSFDFTYFDKPLNKNKINGYPKEFQVKYKVYQKDTSKRWQELDSKNTICIKIEDENLDFVAPYFMNIFPSVFDIEEYKQLRKTKTKIDNYAILTQKIPVDEKNGQTNKFLIDLETAIQFHNRASQALPDEVGLVTSPMDFNAIKLERDKADKDHVAQAERGYYNESGVSQVLFNSENNSSVGLNKSIITDEELCFSILRQFERWVNRKLKHKSSKTYKFKVKFLDITRFNKDEMFDRLLKAAQFSKPVKIELYASLGNSPSAVDDMAFLENEVLGLHDKLTPLSSSHTGDNGTSNKAGAKEKDEDNLSDSGLTTRDTGANENRE